MGIQKQTEEKPGDLKAILQQNLSALPDGLREQLEQILNPKEQDTEKTAAQKLKMKIGVLKDLTHRRDMAQTKTDQAKENYKTALTDLQELQAQLEKEQAQLKETTEQYAKLALEHKIEEPPQPNSVEEEVMWQMFQQAGITISDEQKTHMQKMMVENAATRRRTAGLGASEFSG